jgi:hypothetical protein
VLKNVLVTKVLVVIKEIVLAYALSDNDVRVIALDNVLNWTVFSTM